MREKNAIFLHCRVSWRVKTTTDECRRPWYEPTCRPRARYSVGVSRVPPATELRPSHTDTTHNFECVRGRSCPKWNQAKNPQKLALYESNSSNSTLSAKVWKNLRLGTGYGISPKAMQCENWLSSQNHNSSKSWDKNELRMVEALNMISLYWFGNKVFQNFEWFWFPQNVGGTPEQIKLIYICRF